MKRKKSRINARFVLRTFTCYLVAFCFIAPFLYLILSSFKKPVDLQAYPPKLFFSGTLDNYTKIFSQTNLLPYIGNSLIVSIIVTLIALALGIPAAYAISRYQFRGRAAIANSFLIIQLAPAVAMILPFFILATNMGIYNTKTALVLAYLPWNIPYAVWMLRGFIISTPAAVEEAGMVDGCTRFQAFLRLTKAETGSPQ